MPSNGVVETIHLWFRQGKVWLGLVAEARGKGQPLDADSQHFNNASNFGVNTYIYLNIYICACILVDSEQIVKRGTVKS